MANGSGAAAPRAEEAPRAAYRGPSLLAPTEIALEPVRRLQVLAHLSGAFDLAEAQPVGHACRVAFLSTAIARRLALGAPDRRRVLAVALLHDAGVPVRAAAGHLDGGAWVASRFGFGGEVEAAIRATHERWDGKGRPRGLAAEQIPLEALIVAAAHWTGDLTEESGNPLRARARLQRLSPLDVEPVVGPAVTRALGAVLRDDRTWMMLWRDDLAAVIAAEGAGEGRPSLRKLERAARAMGEVVDAAVREPGRSARVARLARELGRRLGLPDQHRRAIEVAGHLLDLGQLGVPRHVTEKPSILSLDEMEQMRRHPGLGASIVERVPGLTDVGRWVQWHHERPDGRGYPEMLTLDEIPLQPRILAVADAYHALLAERPYRPALSPPEALALLRAGAGQQFDESVVAELPAAVEACRPGTVRSARRPSGPGPARSARSA